MSAHTHKMKIGPGGWIGVDLDGTLAQYHGWQGETHIGAPIEPMVEIIREYLIQGIEVRIFTARIWSDPNNARVGLSVADRIKIIEAWCLEHVGQILPVTCTKDFGMVLLYDDRCVQVEHNTGRLIEDVAS